MMMSASTRVQRVAAAGGLLLAWASAAFAAGSTGAPPPPSGGSGPCPGDGPDWTQYSFAVPGHPVYGFGLPDPFTQTFLGLNAKGNVVIGDYTTPGFQSNTIPLIDPNVAASSELVFPGGQLTRPYAIDPTDEALGYHNNGDNVEGLPMFDGNYNQQDRDLLTGLPAIKPDGNSDPSDDQPRKFYESGLSDAEFKKFVRPYMYDTTGGVGIHATMFTNHGLIGYVPNEGFSVIGAMVGRDDAVAYGRRFWLVHDLRLLGAAACGTKPSSDWNQETALPMSLERPEIVRWREIPVQTPTANGPVAQATCPSGQYWDTQQQRCVQFNLSDWGWNWSVLCTEMFHQGALPRAWFLADTAYGFTYVDPGAMAAYRAWGVPVANLLRHSPVASAVARPLVTAWAQHMAYVMGAAPRDSRLGRWMTRLGLPLHRWLGIR